MAKDITVEPVYDRNGKRKVGRYAVSFTSESTPTVTVKTGTYVGVDASSTWDFSDEFEVKCCNNPKNHKKVDLMVTAYKMCKICKKDLGDWK